MSVATLSNVWTQNQNGSSVQASGPSGQSNSDWLASLTSATASPGAASPDSGTAGAALSDQMQALLMQMQGGNTTAPSAGTSTASTSPSPLAVPPSGAPSGPHHHHHGGSGDGSVDQKANDMFADVAAEMQGGPAATAGSSGPADTSGFFSELKQAAGSAVTDLKDVLKTYGAAAIKGAATGAVMAAI